MNNLFCRIKKNKFSYVIKRTIKTNKFNYNHFIGQDYYKNKFSELIHYEYFNNSSFYSCYTPYQAEISQGRLELGYTYQTIIQNITGLQYSNCGLLDHSHSIFESIRIIINYNSKNNNTNKIIVIDENIFDHLKDVLDTYESNIFREQGIILLYVNLCKNNIYEEINNKLTKIKRNNIINSELNIENICGFITLSSDKYGFINKNYNEINKLKEYLNSLKKNKILHVISGDLLHHLYIKSHKELGGDIGIGNIQRLGLPLFNGGPHSGYMCVNNELIRYLPGRIIGISKNKYSNKVYRLALQTREQHIKKMKATSNICTNQSLMNNYMALYTLEHGEIGLRDKLNKIMKISNNIKSNIKNVNNNFLDTISFYDNNNKNMFYKHRNSNISSATFTDIDDGDYILKLINSKKFINSENTIEFDKNILRNSSLKIFDNEINKFENKPLELIRYIKEISMKDYSLNDGIIPLGSCTMKLNHPKHVSKINNHYLINKHPFYNIKKIDNFILKKIKNQEKIIYDLTGFTDSSFQTMSGSHSELISLLMMKKYTKNKYPNIIKDTILVSESAHGTNFSSVNIANLNCVTIKHYDNGYINLNDLKEKIKNYGDKILGMMVTFPSTYGFYDDTIIKAIHYVKKVNGIIYLDGANMNSWVGKLKPYELGFDIMHINLHKTFNIPHGGGGPGGGCISTTKLYNLLPKKDSFKVSCSTYGNTCANLISESYINENKNNFKRISEEAVKNANYLKNKLYNDYNIKYVNKNNKVAHEVIIDMKILLKISGLSINDIVKRIIDYGIHPPTVSFPVSNCLMIEPTETESKENLDYLILVMKEIKNEIIEIAELKYDSKNNVFTNAPHSIDDLINWDLPYSIKKGFLPLGKNTKKNYFNINRVDEVYGDKVLINQIKNK